MHQLHKTAGSALLPPPALAVLRSKACRSAVMFGDALSHAECAALLARLSTCDVWDQCAHGRPTVTQLVDLPSLTPLLQARVPGRQPWPSGWGAAASGTSAVGLPVAKSSGGDALPARAPAAARLSAGMLRAKLSQGSGIISRMQAAAPN